MEEDGRRWDQRKSQGSGHKGSLSRGVSGSQLHFRKGGKAGNWETGEDVVTGAGGTN